MSAKLTKTAAALAGLALLAGCGNDTDQLATGKLLRTAGSQVLSQVTPGGKKPAAAPTDPAAGAQAEAQLASAALQSLPGPVMLGTLSSMGGTTVLGMVGQNGARRSYQTPTKQMVVTEGGMVIATRGLGHDLQSADVAQNAALIRAGRAGSSNRTMRYLDGEWTERPLPMSCTIAPQGAIALGAGISATKVVETCEGAGLRVENNYLLRGGQIIASRQWLGPQLGYIDLKVLRN